MIRSIECNFIRNITPGMPTREESVNPSEAELGEMHEWRACHGKAPYIRNRSQSKNNHFAKM